MAIVPHEEPVLKAMNADMRNTSVGRIAGEIESESPETMKTESCRSVMALPSDHAKQSTAIGSSRDLRPSNHAANVSPKDMMPCTRRETSGKKRPVSEAQSRALKELLFANMSLTVTPPISRRSSSGMA